MLEMWIGWVMLMGSMYSYFYLLYWGIISFMTGLSFMMRLSFLMRLSLVMRCQFYVWGVNNCEAILEK